MLKRISRESRSLAAEAEAAVERLRALSTPHDLANLARFGIDATKPLGVSVANIRVLAKELGRDHELALALWDTEWYEARMLTAFVDEPAKVTPEQMDRWCADFDNWGICDTLCFHLFDRTPHAWDKIRAWSEREEEFVQRAAFALLASVAGHDKKAGDAPFLASLPLIERAAGDPRNFVKKGVSWALRRIGTRSPVLKDAALSLARRLSTSPEASARWIGKDAIRDLTKPPRGARAEAGAVDG